MRRNPYGFTVESELSVEKAEAGVRRLLRQEGFDVLTEINVRKVLEDKLGLDFREYRWSPWPWWATQLFVRWQRTRGPD